MLSYLGLLLCASTDAQTLPNDNWSDAISVPPEGGDYVGNNASATAEPGEPHHAGIGSGKSLWWKWTGPTNGELILDTQRSFGPVVAVYQGDSLTNLALFAANYPPNGYSPATLRVKGIRKGSTYYIALDGIDGTAGSFELSIFEFAAPPNDDFVGRLPLTGLPVSAPSLVNAQATREPGEPVHPGGGNGGTLWWTWTSPITGWVGVTPGPLVNANVAFYKGESITNLTLVGAGHPFINGVLAIPVQAGQSYQIVVYSPTGDTGTIYLNIMQGVVPDNDLFANARHLAGTNVSDAVDNSFAGLEPGESQNMPGATGKTVWWTWTAPDDGVVSLNTETQNARVGATLYAGASLSNLNPLGYATNDVSWPIYCPAKKGVTYYIAGDGIDGNYGGFTVAIRFWPYTAVVLQITQQPRFVHITWPANPDCTLLEMTDDLHRAGPWTPFTDPSISLDGQTMLVYLPSPPGQMYFRLRFYVPPRRR